MFMRKQLKKFLSTIFAVLLYLGSIAPPSVAAEGELTAIRGSFFDFIDDPWKHVGKEEESARFYSDGLLVLENGKVKAYGPYAEIAPTNCLKEGRSTCRARGIAILRRKSIGWQ
jgi:hypothetical protein